MRRELRVTILSAAPFIHFFSQADKPPPCDLITLPHAPQSDAVRGPQCSCIYRRWKWETPSDVTQRNRKREKKNKILTRCHTWSKCCSHRVRAPRPLSFLFSPSHEDISPAVEYELPWKQLTIQLPTHVPSAASVLP